MKKKTFSENIAIETLTNEQLNELLFYFLIQPLNRSEKKEIIRSLASLVHQDHLQASESFPLQGFVWPQS